MPLAHSISRSYDDPRFPTSTVNHDLICESDPAKAVTIVKGYAQPFERVAVARPVMLSDDVFDQIRNFNA
jgi:hypothetical protein